MKNRNLLTGLLLAVLSSWASAQNGPGPGSGSGGDSDTGAGSNPGSGSGSSSGGTPSGPNSYSHSWSNYYSLSNNFAWGTNALHLGNAPAPNAWSNQYQHSFASPGGSGSTTKWQSRSGQPILPTDAQAIIQQFQQDRQRLMTQLKTASDAQRQQILKDMEQMRTRLREQVSKLRDQAQQQAEQMRARFGNNRDRVLEQGAGSPNGGGGRDR